MNKYILGLRKGVKFLPFATTPHTTNPVDDALKSTKKKASQILCVKFRDHLGLPLMAA